MLAPTATGAAATMVPPEKRGFTLAVVITGLTASTALGTPIGAIIGGFRDWRWTIVFLSALAVASGLGVLALLAHIPCRQASACDSGSPPLATRASPDAPDHAKVPDRLLHYLPILHGRLRPRPRPQHDAGQRPPGALRFERHGGKPRDRAPIGFHRQPECDLRHTDRAHHRHGLNARG
ncbi:MAG: MFS transporter [Janthinobacterium lividum]